MRRSRARKATTHDTNTDPGHLTPGHRLSTLECDSAGLKLCTPILICGCAFRCGTLAGLLLGVFHVERVRNGAGTPPLFR